MKTGKTKVKSNSLKKNTKMEELHRASQQWKSMLRFIEDEMIFIDRLLNSYVFEPDTPNLFERLQNYLNRMKKSKSKKSLIERNILNHESDLGGILECKDGITDKEYCQSHNKLGFEVMGFVNEFQVLKSEIFNYAGGILKKRRPHSGTS
ncbi:hypothetical protein [Ulvibacterium marinum]|uniref:hypothetical protein n=1 Tax=Ulvibacterium marinum TaxID=2419782 RepID=UPI002495A3CE|nr:hypothetical protein [Ulvibacterium marinum]